MSSRVRFLPESDDPDLGGAGSSFVVTGEGATLPLAVCPCLRADPRVLGKTCFIERSVEPTAAAEAAGEPAAEAAVSLTFLNEGS